MITLPRTILIAALSVSVMVLAAGPALAQDAGEAGQGETEPELQAPEPEEAKLKLRLKGDGKVGVGDSASAVGTLKPFVAGQKVLVQLRSNGKTKSSTRVKVRRKKGANDAGYFNYVKRIVEPGKYKITATHFETKKLGEATGKTRRFKITYPSLRRGDRGASVRLLNRLLDDLGYVTASGEKYGGKTARAVLAYRKTNNMARTTSATSGIFRRLAAGKGAFKLQDPGNGKQIEVDISRQVMALAVDGEVIRTYHVSTGAAATPTVRGKWTFYRRHAGYNAIGMYWSSFWVRGYAIHGYKSVPTHPASHGCVRTHLGEAKSIYDWIDGGTTI
ncbi:MAG: L,D-transpeptidase, partial [Solirubrobacterales bacterium]